MKMHHPDITAVSFSGESFEADERGVFEVPEEAAADLAAFGLRPWKEPVPMQPATPPARPVAQWSNDDLKAKAADLSLDVEGLDRPALIQAVSAALRANAPQE